MKRAKLWLSIHLRINIFEFSYNLFVNLFIFRKHNTWKTADFSDHIELKFIANKNKYFTVASFD